MATPSWVQAGWQPQATSTSAGGRSVRRMPRYRISQGQIRSLARERLSTEMRPMRRALREALTESQSAATGPLRAYLMQRALQGFSSGIGGAVQRAREYGRTLATEKARMTWQGLLKAWLQRRNMGTPGQMMQGTAGGAPPRSSLAQYAARGGPVNKRKPYIVGEEGPELFVPKQPGRIIPNPKTQERMRKSLFIPKQYGGDVNPGRQFPAGFTATPLFPPTEPSELEEVKPTDEELPESTDIMTSSDIRRTPTPQPTPVTGPSSVRTPGLADYYQALLKQKRRQTPMRTLI